MSGSIGRTLPAATVAASLASTPPAVTARPAGSGSGSGNTTSVTTGADGSITTTVTDAKGNVVTSTKVASTSGASSSAPPGSQLSLQA